MNRPILTLNNMVACEPPAKVENQNKVVNGVRQPTHRSGLVPLKVVFGVKGETAFSPGDTIYVQSLLLANQKWATDVMELDGKPLIFVPLQVVMLHEVGGA